ncbi:MAG: YebC/PmpR family DNA-binding transcriptional regulator, partial [Flavobacteriaceae bacterium]
VQKELEKRGFEILSSGFERIPQTTKQLDSAAQEEVLQLIERIEEDDDVQNVYHTLDIQE